MANTFGSTQTRVQTRVIDLPTNVQNEIPNLINEGIDALTAIHNFQVMKAEIDFTTTQQTHLLGQMPTDWKEPRGAPYYVLFIGSTRTLVYGSSREFIYREYDPIDPNAIGPPRMLLIGEPSIVIGSATNTTTPADPSNPDNNMTNLNIEVYPFPDGQSDWGAAPAGEYRVNIPYWRYMPPLVNASDTNWFVLQAQEFLVDFATARAFMINWDEQRAGFWMEQAVGKTFDGVNEVTLGGWGKVAIRKDKSISFAPGRTLTPRRDVYAPTNQWRT